MAKCKFCQRRFQSEQGVKAHLKHCKRYQTIQRKKTPALGTKPEATATPAATPLVQPSPPVAAQDLTAPLLDFVKAMSEAATKRDAPQTSQQQRRKILEATKAQVIDRTWTPLGQVTASMRGGAKLAIERELASLPLEELPFDEVCEFAAAIRDCSYAPAFNKQTRNKRGRPRVRMLRTRHGTAKKLKKWPHRTGRIAGKPPSSSRPSARPAHGVKPSRSSHGNGSRCSATSNRSSRSS
jgi:hypothetical protein